MKSLNFSIFLFLLISFVFASCKKEETLTATNFTANLTAVADAQVVGTISAEASSGEAIAYVLTNQNVAGALAVNPVTGQIIVLDSNAIETAYCGLQQVTTLTATVTVGSGELLTTCTITITLSLGTC